MTREFGRSQRVAQELKKEISLIIQREIKDPRLDMMITVSGVDVSRDLAFAKVYVTFLNENTEDVIKTNLKILQDTAGYIRKLLAKTMRLRIVPELTFSYDSSLTEGLRMSTLIANTLQNDSERRQAAEQNDEKTSDIP